MKKLLGIVTALLIGGIAMAQSKSAVVYFSATGTTKAVAQQIAKITGGDIIEIQPKQSYTSADLNWNDKNSRTTKEKNDRDEIRPEIANKIDVSKYDTIYLGFPIWWYEAPNIIYTFVENASLEGKAVYTFFTSGGSGIGQTLQILGKKSEKDSLEEREAIWRSYKRC